MNAQYMKWLDMASTLLVVIGAVNWGLVGLLNMNLVNLLVGSIPSVERLVYVLVGVAGFWLLYDWWMKMSKK